MSQLSTSSVFGVNFPDPIQAATSFSWNGKDLRRNVRYQKKMMKFQDMLNRQSQIWTAHNMPSATVEGLRNANLNPLLAYSDFSGLSSAGAMGVSPSSVTAESTDTGSGGFSVDPKGVEDLFAGVKGRKKMRQNIEKSADVKGQELEVLKDTSSAKASAQVEADIAENVARGKESSARVAKSDAEGARAELDYYMTMRQLEAVTGREQMDRKYGPTRGTDAMNGFWNDFFREKQSKERYEHSAWRVKADDAIKYGGDLMDIIGKAVPWFKRKDGARYDKKKKRWYHKVGKDKQYEADYD